MTRKYPSTGMCSIVLGEANAHTTGCNQGYTFRVKLLVAIAGPFLFWGGRGTAGHGGLKKGHLFELLNP